MCLQNKIVIHNICIDYSDPEPFIYESAINSLMLKIKRLNWAMRGESNVGKRTYYLTKLKEYREQLDKLVEEMVK